MMNRIMVGVAAAALATAAAVGFGAQSAAAATGSWTLDAPQSHAYAAQVQQPINADGSSVWPARRGVIAVQFKVTDTSSFAFESLAAAQSSGTSASGAYSAASFTPSDGMTVNQLTSLVANYTWVSGTDHGGALRWSIQTPAGNVHVYFGDYPNFTSESAGDGSGVNLLTSSDLRFDTSQVGGTFYDTWAHAQQLVGNQPVQAVSLVLDGGWGGDQILNLSAASVNGNAFTMPAGTTTQTNAPAALLHLTKTAGTNPGAIDETTVTSAQGDTGGQFRAVDGKYIYNLDVSVLSGVGTYQASINIGGNDLQTPATFGLK
jgi:hypothetical protein